MFWTLKKKILLGYCVALTLLAVVLVLGILNLQQLGRASDAILSENYRSIRAAEHMINALERQDSGMLLYLLGLRDRGGRQFSEGQSEFLQWLGRAKDNITIEGERELLARVESLYSQYVEAFAGLRRENVQEGAGAAAAYTDRVSPDFLAVREAMGAFRDLNQRTMFDASARARAISQQATLSLSAVGILVIAFGLTFSLTLANRLTRPIAEITRATRRISGGDYEVEVPASTSDELGTLARAFNRMARELRSYREMNVEELKAEKRKSEAIIESIEDGLIVVDADLRIVDINPAARRLLGRDSRDVEGRHLLEVLKNEALFSLLETTVNAGKTPDVGEQDLYLTTSLDGETRHYLAAVAPVHVSGRQHGAVLLFRDVTELRELDRVRREFLATVSHELKTPLTSIAMSVDLLAESTQADLDPQAREHLNGVREDVGRLRTLVGELLDLSRLEAGKIELDIQPVEVELICGKALQVLGAQARDQGVKLELDVAERLPRVRADVNKVTWVLTNLMSNALRYSSSGGRIDVCASRAGSNIEVAVRDYGAGIPYEYQSRIFDRFVRVGKGAPAGSGLGLAICREIVRAHGGSIWVDSVPDKGSTFVFTLPVAGLSE